MNLRRKMEVECWSEDWGIPSVDPETLKILAFAKFSGAPLLQKSRQKPRRKRKMDIFKLENSFRL